MQTANHTQSRAWQKIDRMIQDFSLKVDLQEIIAFIAKYAFVMNRAGFKPQPPLRVSTIVEQTLSKIYLLKK